MNFGFRKFYCKSLKLLQIFMNLCRYFDVTFGIGHGFLQKKNDDKNLVTKDLKSRAVWFTAQ